MSSEKIHSFSTKLKSNFAYLQAKLRGKKLTGFGLIFKKGSRLRLHTPIKGKLKGL